MTVGIVATLTAIFIVCILLSVLIITTDITSEFANYLLEGVAITTFCLVTAIHYAGTYDLKTN